MHSIFLSEKGDGGLAYSCQTSVSTGSLKEMKEKGRAEEKVKSLGKLIQ
jgi:hypothetical protein